MEVDVHNAPGGRDPEHVKLEHVDAVQEALVDARIRDVRHGSKLENNGGRNALVFKTLDNTICNTYIARPICRRVACSVYICASEMMVRDTGQYILRHQFVEIRDFLYRALHVDRTTYQDKRHLKIFWPSNMLVR